MKFLKKTVLALLFAFGATGMGMAEDYGLPSSIQDGNILHCFNWSMAEVKAELPNIAAAGFGTVQLSPLQRPDIRSGEGWHALYRPYDIAFKASSFMGSESDLQSLCQAAESYGIKVIVDVVANHVDKSSGYHDTWWDSNGRVRWNGGINYGDRYSITHGQLGDYGDVNSESAEVIARAKAYVEKLKSLGVKGCRWDAAKHIGLPSEGCNFWSSVTSVPGMYHYGEILDSPGPNASIIKEYAQYMSVTDNRYSNGAAQSNGGICYGHGGEWAVNQGLDASKLVYWAESHDTYANDEWSQNVDQSVIDRAYACIACRNGSTALYLARPNAKGFGNIKVGKGSVAFKNKHIAEVNKFRNKMVGTADWCSAAGNTFTVTRKGGGAVIVSKGSGNVTVENGGGYCPAGTYTDRISGNKFTVTATTISGNIGSTGIAVIYDPNFQGGGGNDDPIVNPTPDPNPNPTVPSSLYILGDLQGATWSTSSSPAMTKNGDKFTAEVTFVAATGQTRCYFNLSDALGADWDALNAAANRYGAATEGVSIAAGGSAPMTLYAKDVNASACMSWTVAPGKYTVTADFAAMTVSVSNGGGNDDPIVTPTPDPTPTPDGVYCYFNNNQNWNDVYVWAWDSSNAQLSASTSWPGEKLTEKDSNGYYIWKTSKGTPVQIIFSTNNGNTKAGGGDLNYQNGKVYDCSGNVTDYPGGNGNIGGGNDDDNNDNTGDFVIYYDNTDTKFSPMHIHYWGDPLTDWPGVAMTSVTGNIYKYVFPKDASGVSGFLFCNGGNGGQTDDYKQAPVNGHLYKGAAGYKGQVTDMGVYSQGNDQTKPVVTASPASGTTFSDEINVTLSVKPAATIYYTLDGSNPSTTSAKYTGAISLYNTTTVKTLAVTAGGVKSDVQTFTYTKGSSVVIVSGDNLNTDYYKVNPNGKVGTNRTVNMKFSKVNNDNRMCVADNALNNWTDADMIAQGVARDVASAIRGWHEYPCVDSYAIYAAYDSQNLYLGVQYVYTVWDLYGDGKITNGATKPYNMDGRLMIAFDLDPNKSMDGVLTNGNTIWDSDGQYNTFDNGTDCIWLGSTKSTVGTPGLFFPNASGKTSYDAPYCVSIDAPFYGCQDGLLPSITHIWGQKEFGYDPEALKGNDGFVDLISEVPTNCHTFYEFKFPLSKLGITESYIRNTGIGVMVVDTYGQGAIGSTPYDATCFDAAKTPYSKDESSSAEKEDKDVFTFAHARIGRLANSAVETIETELTVDENAVPEYYNLQGVRVNEPTPGIYIVRRGNVVTKEVVR